MEKPVDRPVERLSVRREDLYLPDGPQGFPIIDIAAKSDSGHTQIYPENYVFTPDSRRFVFHRRSTGARGRRIFCLCDMDDGYSIRQLTGDDEATYYLCNVTHDGKYMMYFTNFADRPGFQLKRVNLESGAREAVMTVDAPLSGHSFATSIAGQSAIRHDNKAICTHGIIKLPWDEDALNLLLILDLEKCETSVILEGNEDFPGLHMQYARTDALHDIMVQQNHGRTPSQIVGTFESIDRGITLDDSGSRTVALTCFPALTGAVSSGSPVGSGDGDIALYVRTLDLARPRQICFFRFSTMQNYHLFDDPDATPFVISPEGTHFYHISQNGAGSGGRALLTRISFEDFAVDETAIVLPSTFRVADGGACVSERHFLFFAEEDGIYLLCGAPLCGGPADVLARVHGTPRSIAALQQGIYLTAQVEIPTGTRLFARDAYAASLYYFSYAQRVLTRVDAPPLFGSLACAAGVLAVPLLSGGLYFPSTRASLATEYAIERASLSHDGRYFAFTAAGDDFIYMGSTATGRAFKLNRHKGARGLGWQNQPSCAFTGDRRWVIFGSSYTNVPQVYAAYVPKNFPDKLDRWEGLP